jgi:hypothetical protein
MPIRSLETDPVMGCAVVMECDACGQQWRRPDDDPHAATLSPWLRLHRRQCPPRA